MSRLGLALLIVAAPLAIAEAAGPEVVAVFDVELSGVSLPPAERRTLDEYLQQKVAAQRGFAVVPRAEVRKRLRQAKAESYSECYDQSCQIEIGKELAAQKTVSTKVLKIGDACAVSIVLYDLRSAASAGAADARGGCDVGALVRSVESAVAKLTSSDTGARPIVRSGVVDPQRCPLADTRRVGDVPPNGRGYYCVNAKNERHGISIDLFANGEISQRVEYRDGLSNGTFERFHDHGKPLERGRMENGKRVGTWSRWGRNGVKTDEGPYVGGVKQGTWRRYHGKRGEPYEVVDYARDMKNGPAKTFGEDGVLRYEGQHTDGERSGEWRFYREGRLAMERTFVDGLEHGTTRAFDDDGRVRQTWVYVKGRKEGLSETWRHDDAGKRYLVRRQRYVAGEEEGTREEYRPDGSLSVESGYRGGKTHGPEVGYAQHEGRRYVAYRATHVDGRLHGEWREFAPDGTTKRLRMYENGREVRPPKGTPQRKGSAASTERRSGER